jgi:hypothetical protein
LPLFLPLDYTQSTVEPVSGTVPSPHSKSESLLNKLSMTITPVRC